MGRKPKQVIETISAQEALLQHQIEILKERKRDFKYEQLNLLSKCEKSLEKVEKTEYDQRILAKKLSRDIKMWTSSQETVNQPTINTLIELIEHFAMEKELHVKEIEDLKRQISDIERETGSTLVQIEDYETNKTNEITQQEVEISNLQKQFEEITYSFNNAAKLVQDFFKAETRDLISSVAKTIADTAQRTTEIMTLASGAEFRGQILDKLWLEAMVEEQKEEETRLLNHVSRLQTDIAFLNRRSCGSRLLQNCAYIYQLTDPELRDELEAVEPLSRVWTATSCGGRSPMDDCGEVEVVNDWPITDEMLYSI